PASIGVERLRTILRFGLFTLLLLSPLPFGSVRPGAVLGLEIGAAVLGSGALGVLLLCPERPTRLERLSLLLLGAVAAIGVLQLIPLPAAWIRLLAGPTAAAREALRGTLPEAAARAAPLSLSPSDTLDAVLRLFAYLLIGLTALVVLRERRHLQQAALVIVVSGSFQALYGSFEYLSGRQHIFGYVKKYYLAEATGTFINRNHYAAYLAMTLPFALGLLAAPLRGSSSPRRNRWRDRVLLLARSDVQLRLFGALATFCIWVGLVLSYSRAGLAAGLLATVATGLFLATSRRRVLALLAVALVVPTLYLMYLDVNAPGERLALLGRDLAPSAARPTVWSATSRIVADYPLLGSGLGTFESAFPAYRPSTIRAHWDHAHNDWLQSAAEGGLLIPLLLAALCYLLLRGPRTGGVSSAALLALSGCAAAGIAAISFHSIVDFGLRIPAIATLLVALAGIRIVSDRLTERAQTAVGPRSTYSSVGA
ncbi:MAG: O-antigen ligase family protein, partial [Planctomycetota bacterium]